MALLLIAGAGLFGGCQTVGAGEGPEPRPTAAVLREMRAAPYPVYWLGPRFRGRELAAASVAGSGAIARYGRPSCGTEGCDYPVSVISALRRPDAFAERGDRPQNWGSVCFRSLRGAVLMMCPDDGEWELFTGRSDIAIKVEFGRVDELDIVDGLIPMNAAASSSRRLPPPQRLTCGEYDGLAGWFARKLPPELRPRGCA